MKRTNAEQGEVKRCVMCLSPIRFDGSCTTNCTHNIPRQRILKLREEVAESERQRREAEWQDRWEPK